MGFYCLLNNVSGETVLRQQCGSWLPEALVIAFAAPIAFLCGGRFVLSLVRFAFLIFVSISGQALAAAEPVTCQMTTERVLAPYLLALEKAEQAMAHHAAETAAKVARLTQYNADLLALKNVFDQSRDKDLAGYDQRIAGAAEAIDLIQKHAREELKAARAGLQDALERQSKGDADYHRQRIQSISERLAAGETKGYAPALGWSNSMTGWKTFIADQQKERAERQTLYGQGMVKVYQGFLGYVLSWQGVLDLVEQNKQALAFTRARKEKFYLPSLGYPLPGDKLDAHYDKQQENLAEARRLIAAGDFKLYVPTLGYPTTRKAVLAEIGKARASLAAVKAGWADGTYKAYNNAVGYVVVKGTIDDWISETLKAMAEYKAKGDEARAWVATLGYATTARELKAQAAKAQKPEDRSAWARHLASWREGRAAAIADFEAKLAKHRATLQRHREIWQDDIAKRQEDLDGRLARALAETPCGGGNPEVAYLDRLSGVLTAMSESDIERQCRLDRLEDLVFITASGVQHGDPRAGFLSAVQDTGTGDGTLTRAPELPMALDELMLMLKNHADVFAAAADGLEFRLNRSALTQLSQSIAGLRAEMEEVRKLSRVAGSGVSIDDFSKARRAAAAKVQQAVTKIVDLNGYFFSSDFDDVIAAFESDGLKNALRNREARASLQKLQEMRQAATALNRFHLPRLAGMAADFGRVTEANLEAARSMMATVRTGEIGAAIGEMDVLERGMLAMTLAAAVAETSDRIGKGEAVSEAISRSSVNMTVELVIGGMPVTAASQAVSLLVFNTAAAMATDPELKQTLKEVNVENIAKAAAQGALDQVAGLSAALGEASAASEFANLDQSASREQIEQSLATAENRLEETAPGSMEAQRLMRARASLRRLLRAKDRAVAIAEQKDLLQEALVNLAGDTTGDPNLIRAADEARARLDLMTAFDC